MGDTSDLKLLQLLIQALKDSPSLVMGNIFKEFPTLRHEDFQDKSVHIFTQTASSTACGWGGMGGQAFTDYFSVGIEYTKLKIAIIYQAYKAAYIVKIDENYIKYRNSGRFPEWVGLSNKELDILWKASK